ncbi:MAG TPA: hypothetical protein VE863_03535 [Pyrinomonadaceae bacterium]|nr:hypothetical protein [Pyrinomonadaceae bacterium]
MLINNIKWQFRLRGRIGTRRRSRAFVPHLRIRLPGLRQSWCASISERFLRGLRQPRRPEMILAASQSARLFNWNLQMRLRLVSRPSFQFFPRIHQEIRQVFAASSTERVIAPVQREAAGPRAWQTQLAQSLSRRQIGLVSVAADAPSSFAEKHSITSGLERSRRIQPRPKRSLQPVRLTHAMVTGREATTLARRSFETSEHIVHKLGRVEALQAVGSLHTVVALAASRAANDGGATRTSEPAAFASVARRNQIELATSVTQLADAVLKELDRRMISARERLGRI